MIFKKKIFWVHLFRGPVGGVKNKNSIQFLFQHLLNFVLGKVKKFEGPSYHGSWAIAKCLWGPPMGHRVQKLFHSFHHWTLTIFTMMSFVPLPLNLWSVSKLSSEPPLPTCCLLLLPSSRKLDPMLTELWKMCVPMTAGAKNDQ